MSLGRYTLVVLAFAAATLAVVGAGFRESLGPAGLLATVVGACLAAANTLAAYGLVVWSRGRSAHVFMGSLLGGMLGRMAVMLAAVAAGILYFGLPQVPLVFSLLAYFVSFLVLELCVVQKRTLAERP